MKERKSNEANMNYLKQVAYQNGMSFYCKTVCAKCYGRGYIGTRIDGKKVPCRCVIGIRHQPAIKNLENTLKEKKESENARA